MAPSPSGGTRPIALLLGALVVTSVVAFDPWGFAPFGPMKLLFVVGLVVASALFALVRRSAAHLPRFVIAAWIALFAAMLVATVAALDPLHAWIGTPDRRLGLATWALFGLAFAAGATIAEHDGRLLARAASLAALFAGAYAVLELADITPVHLEFAEGRAGGPFGQPAYLGAAMALLVPISCGLALDRHEQPRWRALAVAGALSGFVALLASQTRAAWVGTAAAGVFLLCGDPRARGALRRAWPLAVSVGLVVIAVAVATPLGARALSMLDVHDGTARGRLDEWQVATRALLDRPVVGVGPEGYRIVFPRAVDADYERRYGREVVPDRAHNGPLDVGVTGGVVAVAAYLSLAVAATIAAWRVLRASTAPWLAGVAVGIVAYLVQQQFLFPLAEVDPMFWAFAGLLIATCAPAVVRPRRPLPTGALRFAAIPLAMLGAFACVEMARDVVADRALHRAIEASADADHETALAAADRATRLRPDSIRNWYVAARTAAAGDTIVDVGAALDRIEAGLRRSPRDPILRSERGSLLLEWARRSERPRDRAAAVAALEQVVASDPNDAEQRLRLGLAFALGDDLTHATEQLRRAVDLAPTNPAPSLDLALVRLRAGDHDGATQAVDRALRIDPTDSRAHSLLERLAHP